MLAITARLLLQYVSRPGERFFGGVRLHTRACVCTQRLQLIGNFYGLQS